MKKKFLIIFFIFISLFSVNSFEITEVKAENLSTNIENQLDKIDLSELEEYFNSVCATPTNKFFMETLKSILKGEVNSNFDSLFSYILELIEENFSKYIPLFISIIIISILSGLIQNFKSSYASSGVNDIVFYVCFLGVVLLVGNQIINFYFNTKNIIENIAILTEIMSPIMLTLMIASGGSVSASVYKPAVLFLSNGVINMVLSVILPLVGIIGIFSIISNINPSMKLLKFSDGANSIIKWIIGIVVSVFSLFLSIQGLTSASIDGISIRATKYAISNSVPMIGGFLKDGFDLVIAGSVIIKNCLGIISVSALFYTILAPILEMATFSIILKFLAGFVESFGDSRLSNLCIIGSKIITYLTISIFLVGFMLFITLLLMVMSANAFI